MELNTTLMGREVGEKPSVSRRFAHAVLKPLVLTAVLLCVDPSLDHRPRDKILL
jgi:hypothetical protein